MKLSLIYLLSIPYIFPYRSSLLRETLCPQILTSAPTNSIINILQKDKHTLCSITRPRSYNPVFEALTLPGYAGTTASSEGFRHNQPVKQNMTEHTKDCTSLRSPLTSNVNSDPRLQIILNRGTSTCCGSQFPYSILILHVLKIFPINSSWSMSSVRKFTALLLSRAELRYDLA